MLDAKGKSTLPGPKKAAPEQNTVTFSAGGKSVTMTDEQFKAAANRARVKDAQDADDAQFKGAENEVGGISGARLKAFIERIERLEEEKTAIAEDVKDIYAESKAVGFDTKTIRKVIRLRKMDAEKRKEEEEILELYKAALGME